MKNISKRLLALAIALVMVIGMVPVIANTASAEGEGHTNCPMCTEEGIEWKVLSDDAFLDVADGTTNIVPGYYYLEDDYTLPSMTGYTIANKCIDLRGDEKVVICLNGHTLSSLASTRLARLAGSSSLTIVDCAEGFDTGKITPASNNTNGSIYLANTASLTLEGVVVDGGTFNNGFIYVGASGNKVNVIDSKIMNVTANSNGGAFYVNGGEVNVIRSTITNCTANRGSCAYLAGSSKIRFEDAVVTGNTSTNWGCVTVNSVNGDVTIAGNTQICDNINPGSSYGGLTGICLQYGSNMTASIKLENLGADANVYIWSQLEQSTARDWDTNPPVTVVSGTIPMDTLTYTVCTKVDNVWTPANENLFVNSEGKIGHCAHEWVDDECQNCGLVKEAVVAQIGSAQYATLDAAIEAAQAKQTITLMSIASIDELTLPEGVTLDLNGKILTASTAATMAGKITDSVGTGVLKVAHDNATFAADNDLAVWNGVDGYIFSAVEWKVKALKNDNGTYKVRFIPVTSAAVAELLKNGGSANDFELKLNITWNDGSKTYKYSDALVNQLYTGNNGVASSNYVFTFSFTGVESFENLKIAALVVGGGNTVDNCGYEWEV